LLTEPTPSTPRALSVIMAVPGTAAEPQIAAAE
jgi:hypothetical protein